MKTEEFSNEIKAPLFEAVSDPLTESYRAFGSGSNSQNQSIERVDLTRQLQRIEAKLEIALQKLDALLEANEARKK